MTERAFETLLISAAVCTLMKKLFSILIAMLALNFLAAAGGAGWLYKTGHLDKDRAIKIRELLFPAPDAPTTQPSAPVAVSAAPTLRLDTLLEKERGRPVAEQIDFVKRTFDQEMLMFDRRQRELSDLQKQIDLANLKLASDRAQYKQDQAALLASKTAADKLQSDKGFQDSLALYSISPPKQVKTIFMNLGESTVEQYLDAMDQRTAAKIIKEFKTPAETAFIQAVLERMRLATVSDAGKLP
jgi:hypothetical protein